MKLRIWKWYHYCEEPTTELFSSEEAAWNAIFDYVYERWQDDAMDEPIPLDKKGAISLYFETYDDAEWYSLDYQDVRFPDLLGKENEVILSAEECLTAMAALGAISYTHLAQELGITKEQACEYSDSAYEKLKV